MESKTSHIRITQNGIQRTADIHQIIDDFGIISSDEEADDAFDVAAEVQEMYNTVKLYTNGIEEEAFEDNEPDSDTDDIPLAELVRIPKSSTTNKNQSKEFHVYHWRKRTSPHVDSEYTGPTFSEPLVGLWPCDYFMLFVDKSMIDNCFEQTNLYAAQKAIAKGLSVPFTTTTDSIEQFFGILLFMGITKFPSYRMYWAEETRVSAVTDIMSRNDFENLKSYMHFNDDSLMLKRESDNYDPIYKARPFVNQLRQNCLKIEPEEKHSIDKMIIPTKARWGIKQYIPSKPHPWGMKIFSRCGVLGFVYDFFVFTGADKNPTEQALSASSNVVARLCTTLPKNVGHKVYFDNYFTSPDLLIYLYSQGIFALGTVPSNGLRGAEKLLISKKDLKAKGRGSHDFIVDANLTLCALRWLDNGVVNMVSNFLSDDAAEPAKRWSAKDKAHIEIPRPAMIMQYNLHMGGVDLADMLTLLYCIKLGSKKAYMRLIFFCLNTAVVNAWLLYCRHSDQLKIRQKDVMSLIVFQSKVANSLMKRRKVIEKMKRGRTSLTPSEPAPISKLGRKTVAPHADVCFDFVDHFPCFIDKQQKCILCCQRRTNGYTFVKCSKCNVNLCFMKNRNCFTDYHMK